MIACGSKVWFRPTTEAEWERGGVTLMTAGPPARNDKDKVPKTLISVEVQNEFGDALGEIANVVTSLVEGSLEEFELVKLRNQVDDASESAESVEDLISLTHLHEPAILTCLRKRFDQNLIYTNTGPILIAVVKFILILCLFNTFCFDCFNYHL
jgi:hypothetical protein